MELRIEFSREGLGSVLRPALIYGVVRILAKLLTALAPTTAMLSLVAALAWFAAALYLFVFLTWFRNDDAAAAGILFAATVLVGGLVGDLIVRTIQPGSLGDAGFGAVGSSLGMALRAVILVPLSGGMIAGARWITTELSKSGLTF